MTPLLLMLLGCPGPTRPGPDTEEVCPVAPAVEGCPVFEDCATADYSNTQVVDVCGDGVDNDCDGVADDSRCVDGCVMGSEGTTESLGAQLVVAADDPTSWAATAVDPTIDEVRVLSYQREGDRYEPTVEWNEVGYGSRVAVGSVGGEATLLTTEGELARVDPGSVTPEVYANLGEQGPLFLSDAAGMPDILIRSRSSVLHLIDPADGAAEHPELARATYTSSAEGEELFGESALLLPDPGGDGIPEVVVGAPGTLDWWDASAVYVFDGTDEGALTPADAIATITSDRAYEVGAELARAGDLDGDGYEEVLSSGDVLFGPFLGEVAVASFAERVNGSVAAAGSSVNGDDLPDLVFGVSNNKQVQVFLGPFTPATTTRATPPG